MALNGKMIGDDNGPTCLDGGVLNPLKAVLAKDIHELFEATLRDLTAQEQRQQVCVWQKSVLWLSQD
jgi:hypothetical protein